MKRRTRVIALFMAIILTATAIQLPSQAVDVDVADGNSFKPEQPTVPEATDRMELYAVEAVGTDSVQIQAGGSGVGFELTLEI